MTEPLFLDATTNEGELLEITCLTRNIPDISTFQVLNPNGIPITTILGVYRVPNVTRAFAGTYTCVVTSTIDNSTVNAISMVVIQCKLLCKQHTCTLSLIYGKQSSPWHMKLQKPINITSCLSLIYYNSNGYNIIHAQLRFMCHIYNIM